MCAVCIYSACVQDWVCGMAGGDGNDYNECETQNGVRVVIKGGLLQSLMMPQYVMIYEIHSVQIPLGWYHIFQT